MLRVFESFAGIGTQRMGLERAGIAHEVVGFCEIDKFAIDSYQAIHGETENYGDISKIDPNDLPYFDLFTYSFPCQDISMAGKQKGFEKGSGTRSSLLWECERIIEAKRPKYLLMENVKALTFKKNLPGYKKWLETLNNLGYKNYWKVLNAKDYGVPQNRERVFCISILDDDQGFEFPDKQVLKTRLKDVLEESVDEKYYLSNDRVKQLVGIVRNRGVKGKTIFDTLCARDYKDPKVVRVGGIFDKEKQTHQAGSIYDKEQLCPTLDTMQGGWRQPSVLIKNATKKGYIEASEGDGIDLSFPEPKTRRGRVQKGISQTLDTGDAKGVLIGASRGRNPENPSDRTVGVKTEQRLEINKNGTSNTLTSVQKDNLVVEPYRIRKLTPLECWRLMGIDDKDFYKARKVNSDSQLYKQAGNAIVVDVLAAIFMQLFSNKEIES